jgi:N-acyl-D-amino-acid deacylase
MNAAVSLALAISLASCSSTPMNDGLASKSGPRFARLDNAVRDFLAKEEVPGASIAIFEGGRIIYANGYGFADEEAHAPVTTLTRFRIASLSKPLTSAAILKLVDQGKLTLDDRIVDVLTLTTPHMDPRVRKITIRHLLQHRSGWDQENGFDPMFSDFEISQILKVGLPLTPQQIVGFMLKRKLVAEPGQKYSYSNFGYLLLGQVVERRAGSSYQEFVQKEILAPLGIREMQLGRSLKGNRAANEASYYAPERPMVKTVIDQTGAMVPEPYGGWSIENMAPHGGWIATPTDFAKFTLAMFDKSAGILSLAMLQEVTAPPSGGPTDKYYGLGWMVYPKEGSNNVTVNHFGSLDGTTSDVVLRDTGIGWVIFLNRREKEGQPEMAARIHQVVSQALSEVR